MHALACRLVSLINYCRPTKRTSDYSSTVPTNGSLAAYCRNGNFSISVQNCRSKQDTPLFVKREEKKSNMIVNASSPCATEIGHLQSLGAGSDNAHPSGSGRTLRLRPRYHWNLEH